MLIIKEIYEHINQRIKDKAPNAMQWIDFDLGQLEEETPPVAYPCCLIGFGDAGFQTYTQGNQRGELTIALKFGFKVFERTNNKNTKFLNIAFAHLQHIQAVHNAIHMSEGERFGKIKRIGITQERRLDLRVYEIVYSTQITEDYQNPDVNYINWKDFPDGTFTPAPGLNIETSLHQ